MLISKPIAAQDIVSLRLNTGEEIIGRFVEDTKESVTIKSPASVQLRQLPNGELGMSLVPLMVTAGEDVEISFQRNCVQVLPMRPRKDIAAQYQQATSPIATPPSGLII